MSTMTTSPRAAVAGMPTVERGHKRAALFVAMPGFAVVMLDAQITNVALPASARRPAIIDDTPGQAQPRGLGQRGITVDHEGLLGDRCRLRSRSAPRSPPPRC